MRQILPSTAAALIAEVWPTWSASFQQREPATSVHHRDVLHPEIPVTALAVRAAAVPREWTRLANFAAGNDDLIRQSRNWQISVIIHLVAMR